MHPLMLDDLRECQRERDELLAALREISARLSRRVAHEKHGPECANCEADKALVLSAASLIARIEGKP